MGKVQPVQRKEMTVAIKVFQILCCEGCWKKVYEAVVDTPGVRKFNFDSKLSKLTVVGTVNANEVLEKVQKIKKDAVFFPVEKPKDVLKHPLSITWSKNMAQAPPPPPPPPPGRFQFIISPYETYFSDENPNGCSIM